MRGQITLFKEVFEELPETETKKGRSATLHSRRNECLIDRYYYLGKFSKMRYIAILEALQNEFFLSVFTIPDIITDNYSNLAELQDLRPGKDYFSKKWPHLVW